MDRIDCPSCGESFPSKQKLEVHYNRFHGEILPNQQCAECGEWFDCEYEKKYCSEECHDGAVSYEGEANPHYQGGKETTQCEICETEFEYSLRRRTASTVRSASKTPSGVTDPP